MFILQLNPMMGNFESLRPVARAETKDALMAYVEAQRVEGYSDEDGQNMCGGKLNKSFRKGGVLEFFNPPDREECFVDVGTKEDWAQQAMARYEQTVNSIPPV